MLHIFATNRQTLKVYLEHLFVGVGKEGEMSPFLQKCNVSHNWTKEKTLVSMLSDISRVREGDKIVFYLQETWNQKGKFFGIFEAKSRAFFDEIDNDNFLLQELKKEISYRLLIKPWKVFVKGINEQEVLDSLKGKEKTWQLYWSLIYRKIRGNRGCTAITEFEEKELVKKFMEINDDNALDGTNFSFDSEKEEIILTNHNKDYLGRKESCDIQSRFIYRLWRSNFCESHLQAYIMQNFDNSSLKEIFLPEPTNSFWIGNSVSCGTGLERIDILIKQENEDTVFIKIVELKDTNVDLKTINQNFSLYIEWVIQYFVPSYLESGKKIVIIPCLVTRENEFVNLLDNLKIQNSNTNLEIEKSETILFEAKNNQVCFRKVKAN